MTQANEAQQPADEAPLNAADIERVRTANIFGAKLDNRAVAFNSKIEPLLKQIAEIAQAEGVPFVAAFDITTAANMRDDAAFNMAVGALLPDAPYSERLRQMVAIVRPRSREEQEQEVELMNNLLGTLAKQGIAFPEATAAALTAEAAAADEHEGSTPD